jgi:hypothetical protein
MTSLAPSFSPSSKNAGDGSILNFSGVSDPIGWVIIACVGSFVCFCLMYFQQIKRNKRFQEMIHREYLKRFARPIAVPITPELTVINPRQSPAPINREHIDDHIASELGLPRSNSTLRREDSLESQQPNRTQSQRSGKPPQLILAAALTANQQAQSTVFRPSTVL